MVKTINQRREAWLLHALAGVDLRRSHLLSEYLIYATYNIAGFLYLNLGSKHRFWGKRDQRWIDSPRSARGQRVGGVDRWCNVQKAVRAML